MTIKLRISELGAVGHDDQNRMIEIPFGPPIAVADLAVGETATIGGTVRAPKLTDSNRLFLLVTPSGGIPKPVSESFRFPVPGAVVAARGHSPLGSGQNPRQQKNLPFPEIIDPEDPPIRPERDVINSIATIRRQLAVALSRSLLRCPCCSRPMSPKLNL